MAKQENNASVPALDALKEWLSKNMVDGPLSFSLISQAAPNQHINCYKVETAEGVFFVKIYLDVPNLAEREVEYHQYFKQLSFVPNLRHYISPSNNVQRLIAYEFIEGDDLHQQFTAARQKGLYLPESVMLQAIDQMSEMRDVIRTYDSLLPIKIPWPFKSPIRQDFIPKNVEEKFLEEYVEILTQNKRTLELFPGYYFDRNPRNLMRDGLGVHQVDFGVVERSSPVFDLAKVLRNGTDIVFQNEIDLQSVTSESSFIEQLSTYPLVSEDAFLLYAYQDYVRKNRVGSESSFDNFRLAYHFAAVHSHFFYMTKYLRIMRDEDGQREKLLSRCAYHIALVRKTLQELTLLGYPVGHLENWVDLFITEISSKKRRT